MSRRRVLVITLVFEGFALVVALVLRNWLDLNDDAPLHLDMSALVWGAIATLPMGALLWWMTTTQWGPLRRLSQRVTEMVAIMFRDATFLDVAIVALLAGVCEEYLFRGALQMLLARWGGFWIGLIGSSIVFGVVHFVTPTYVIVVTIMGLYFGTLLHHSNSLIVPIVVHTLYDFAALLYLLRVARRRGALMQAAGSIDAAASTERGVSSEHTALSEPTAPSEPSAPDEPTEPSERAE